jgi:hypothetical protein
MPGRPQIGGRQRTFGVAVTLSRNQSRGRVAGDRGGGLLERGRMVVEFGGEEFVDRAGAGLGLVTDGAGDLAADHAGIRVAAAEAAHVGNRGARERDCLHRVDVGVGRRRLAIATRQQHANQRQPKCHSQQEKHDPTHFPNGVPAVLIEKASMGV